MVIAMDNNYDWGYVIQSYRNQKGLSQEEVALRADITPTYLGQIEHGKKSPTIRVVERICTALGVSLADLFSAKAQTKSQIDPVSEQILANLSDCSEAEKKQLLRIIKAIQQFKKI